MSRVLINTRRAGWRKSKLVADANRIGLAWRAGRITRSAMRQRKPANPEPLDPRLHGMAETAEAIFPLASPAPPTVVLAATVPRLGLRVVK